MLSSFNLFIQGTPPHIIIALSIPLVKEFRFIILLMCIAQGCPHTTWWNSELVIVWMCTLTQEKIIIFITSIMEELYVFIIVNNNFKKNSGYNWDDHFHECRIKIPYPLQWGPPTFNAGHAFGMMAAVLVSLIEVGRKLDLLTKIGLRYCFSSSIW